MECGTSPGPRVRALREARDITLREMAEKMGIHFTHLSKLETGEREWTVSRAQQAAEILNVPVSLILDPSIPVDRLEIVARILDRAKSLPESQLEGLLHLLEALP